jgi:hypothetical protein
MSVIGVGAITFVAIWLLLTGVYQYRPTARVIAPYDFLRILPTWTFFAPRPVNYDYHLLVRDEFTSGSLGDWQELDAAQARSWTTSFWHPGKRRRKIISDAAQMVKRLSRANSPAAIQTSLPYIVILHYCISMCPSREGATARQFMVLETLKRSDRGLRIAFISELHPL